MGLHVASFTRSLFTAGIATILGALAFTVFATASVTVGPLLLHGTLTIANAAALSATAVLTTASLSLAALYMARATWRTLTNLTPDSTATSPVLWWADRVALLTVGAFIGGKLSLPMMQALTDLILNGISN